MKSLGELIEVVKKDPKKYSMATPGIGTVPHLSARLLAIDAKLDLVTVPYGGGGPSLAAVVGNQVPFGCQAVPPVTPHIKASRGARARLYQRQTHLNVPRGAHDGRGGVQGA